MAAESLPCLKCGSPTRIEPGIGPHHAKAVCTYRHCKAWRWLPKPRLEGRKGAATKSTEGSNPELSAQKERDCSLNTTAMTAVSSSEQEAQLAVSPHQWRSVLSCVFPGSGLRSSRVKRRSFPGARGTSTRYEGTSAWRSSG